MTETYRTEVNVRSRAEAIGQATASACQWWSVPSGNVQAEIIAVDDYTGPMAYTNGGPVERKWRVVVECQLVVAEPVKCEPKCDDSWVGGRP